MRLPRPTLSPRGVRRLRALARHRRLVAAVCAATSVVAAVLAVRPPPPPSEPVVVAAADLPGGRTVGAGDVVVRRWPARQPPVGGFRSADGVIGHVLAAPVRRGEPLTDVRLVGAALVDTLPAGQVAVPVRIADDAAAALVGPGTRVDVLAAAPPDLAGGGGAARAVAVDVMVLARPGPAPATGPLGPAPTDPSGGGALVLLATNRDEAAALAGAAAASRLSLVLRRD